MNSQASDKNWMWSKLKQKETSGTADDMYTHTNQWQRPHHNKILDQLPRNYVILEAFYGWSFLYLPISDYMDVQLYLCVYVYVEMK